LSAPAACALLVGAQAPLWANAQSLAAGWLTDSERERHAGMREARQREFIACRYAMRLLLAGGHDAASTWRLAAPRNAAPHVEQGGEGGIFGAQSHLSLSHSAGWLACAAAQGPVGVDIERRAEHRQRDVHAMAEMVCSPPERAWLQAQDGARLQHSLVQLWSLKEAYFKSLGQGLDFVRMRQLAWAPASAALDTARQPLAHGRLWQGRDCDAQAVCLALCMPGPLPEVAISGSEEVQWQPAADWQLVVLA
jgi:phosphopantetheinyl transferase